MAWEIPFFLKLKMQLVSVMHSTADAVHIYIGVAILLVTYFASRKRVPEFWMLLPGFVASIAFEIGDLYYDLGINDHLRWDETLM